jgi:hypothetical protein
MKYVRQLQGWKWEARKTLSHNGQHCTPELASTKEEKKEMIFNPNPAHMMPTRLGICEGRSNA